MDIKKDYHCHILPGLDDGAQTLEDSIYLCETLVRWGFTHANCTPHIAFRYRNTPKSIRHSFEYLQDELKERNIPLSLSYTAEYRFIPETWSEVKEKGWLLPWNDNHILIEFPMKDRQGFKGLDYKKEILWLQSQGYQPVLAHPERYSYMSINELIDIRNMGVEFQCNYGSLCGRYDLKTNRVAHLLIHEEMVSYMGTDLHNQSYIDCIDQLFEKVVPETMNYQLY